MRSGNVGKVLGNHPTVAHMTADSGTSRTSAFGILKADSL